ncbi:C40 family peptidase [Pseudonocardia phyllosphaerae]|uniref:C40 family peptidase n=1 Tax=Pseudonocardia phyllosphaerae TaxID=3390502 RepID=UPI00397983D7
MPQRTTAPALRAAVAATTATAAAVLSLLPATGSQDTDNTPTADAAGATAPGAGTVTRDVAPAAFATPQQPIAQNPAALHAASAAKAAAAATAIRSSALDTAKAQIGKPYSWGASGPSAFDCSGLVQYAFSKAGRDVPRTSSAQASAGTAVSKSALQPGDLVFFYTPVSHVGIYTGNGKVVHASTSGQPVKTSSIDAMPFNSARRL